PFLLAGVGFVAIGITESVFTSPGSPFTLLMWSSLAIAASPVLAAPASDAPGPAPGDELPAPEDELAALAGGVEEERVVATNGRHERVPVHPGSRNGERHLVGAEIGEKREAQSR